MKTVDSYRIHRVKCWPEPFAALRAGDKTHEVRVDDRNYRVRDVLHLSEWDPAMALYSGEFEERLITYKTVGFGLPPGLVVLSVRPFEWLPAKSCQSCGYSFRSYDPTHTACSDCP